MSDSYEFATHRRQNLANHWYGTLGTANQAGKLTSSSASAARASLRRCEAGNVRSEPFLSGLLVRNNCRNVVVLDLATN